MAKKTGSLVNNKKAWILLLIVITFIAGFLVARARYKPQIQTTFDMVMEREETIATLEEKILELEEKMEIEDIRF